MTDDEKVKDLDKKRIEKEFKQKFENNFAATNSIKERFFNFRKINKKFSPEDLL